MVDQLIVVGGGQAGFSLIAKLRALGDTRRITLISNEPELPYQRPPLSKKYLLGELDVQRLFFRPQNWYERNKISFLPQTNIVSIDTCRQEVLFDNGKSLGYSHLALTTGSHALRLPEEIGGSLDGIYTIRSISDIDQMAAEFVLGRTVLVVGGGYIGLEAASVASKLGLNVIVLEREDRILKRVAAKSTSEYFYQLHTSNGVRILQSTGILELLERNGKVCGGRLSNGEEISIDFVICGIGIKPNQKLAEEAGLTVNDGIIVDGACSTSDHKIVAAGDCARFPYKGNLIRLESVQNSIDQGEAAANTLFGQNVDYYPYPWFWSDQFDVKLQIAGLNSGFDQTYTRPGRRAGSESTWYYKEGMLIAADAMNDATSYLVASRLLKLDKSPDFQQIIDPDFDLKSLLK